MPTTPIRILTEAETNRLYGRLMEEWGYWYGGGSDRAHIPPSLTLWSDWIEDPSHASPIRAAILGRGFGQVWELREWGDSFELDVAAAGFAYTGAEGFWTAGEMDWMLYASHESSITFGGGWLIDAVKRTCPGWEAVSFTGWAGLRPVPPP